MGDQSVHIHDRQGKELFGSSIAHIGMPDDADRCRWHRIMGYRPLRLCLPCRWP